MDDSHGTPPQKSKDSKPPLKTLPSTHGTPGDDTPYSDVQQIYVRTRERQKISKENYKKNPSAATKAEYNACKEKTKRREAVVTKRIVSPECFECFYCLLKAFAHTKLYIHTTNRMPNLIPS